jgi:hypothetical protein
MLFRLLRYLFRHGKDQVFRYSLGPPRNRGPQRVPGIRAISLNMLQLLGRKQGGP